ncbi:hypothetical protein TNCV_4342761 [Trichonephila clavipes]|nr:hypothetical protein TNCV_4342761 [Trichonephila clavipes]
MLRKSEEQARSIEQPISILHQDNVSMPITLCKTVLADKPIIMLENPHALRAEWATVNKTKLPHLECSNSGNETPLHPRKPRFFGALWRRAGWNRCPYFFKKRCEGHNVGSRAVIDGVIGTRDARYRRVRRLMTDEFRSLLKICLSRVAWDIGDRVKSVRSQMGVNTQYKAISSMYASKDSSLISRPDSFQLPADKPGRTGRILTFTPSGFTFPYGALLRHSPTVAATSRFTTNQMLNESRSKINFRYGSLFKMAALF